MELNSNTSILITGATGSFGKAFVAYLLENYSFIKKIVIFSRDELKQWDLRNQFPENKYPQIRFFLGDIRDKDRLSRAFEGIDVVIHAAALKQVPAAEYNPMEFIKTNVIGSDNIVQVSLDNHVKKVIALSTDKAAAPVNLYGASKLCADKLFIAANNIKGSRDISFSVVRYGNVMGSRGSVIPLFLEQAKNQLIKITDQSMTRFNITLNQGVKFVCWALENSLGGEIFVPKIPSYRITDLAKAISPLCKVKIIGIRPGEKIHEEMITTSDSYTTYEFDNHFMILPQDLKFLKRYQNQGIDLKKVDIGFKYNSGTNQNFLNIDQIRKLIIQNVDKDFVPYNT